MKEKHLKGLVHGLLALAGIVEVFDAKTRTRKFLTGCMIGWHAHATFYHFVLEDEEDVPKERLRRLMTEPSVLEEDRYNV
jgi:hypothetical protein